MFPNPHKRPPTEARKAPLLVKINPSVVPSFAIPKDIRLEIVTPIATNGNAYKGFILDENSFESRLYEVKKTIEINPVVIQDILTVYHKGVSLIRRGNW